RIRRLRVGCCAGGWSASLWTSARAGGLCGARWTRGTVADRRAPSVYLRASRREPATVPPTTGCALRVNCADRSVSVFSHVSDFVLAASAISMTRLARFELRLLGGATLLAADGEPLAGRAVHRHRVALLAYLALSRPSGASREKLIGVLWPERDAAAARS